MPAASKELAAARKEEIVAACAQLYERLPFKEITIGQIGAKTSFTRTSVYNYFHTKEEIFLALLEREYAAWCADLNALAAQACGEEEFPSRFAALLERRGCMLKLLSMNLYDMEAGSRVENLVAFKKVYYASLTAVQACLRAHCSHLTQEQEQQFLYAFFPFLFGVYPYTEATEKQRRAMQLAGVPYRQCSVFSIVCSFVERLLKSFRN